MRDLRIVGLKQPQQWFATKKNETMIVPAQSNIVNQVGIVQFGFFFSNLM